MPYKNPEDAKAYEVRNKDKIKAYRKAYRKANKEILAAKHKKWQQENKETVNALNRSYRAKNKEKTAAYNKKWRDNNKDKVCTFSANRRALKFRATIRLTELDKFVIDEMYNLARIRTEQTGFEWHVDHIKPLTKGGLHKPTNLQVVPGTWNVSKGNRSEEKWT